MTLGEDELVARSEDLVEDDQQGIETRQSSTQVPDIAFPMHFEQPTAGSNELL